MQTSAPHLRRDATAPGSSLREIDGLELRQGGIVRRRLQSRQTRWAAASASWLTRRRVQPTPVSLASAVFAACAGGCLAASGLDGPLPRMLLLVAAAAGIQLRLLCNLFDGMVAIER